jgi:transglutaminase/protease-like cytokinesis protein 3
VRYLAVTVFVLMFYSSPVFAEFFKWTDSSGTEHFTDDRSRIPSKYRKKAISMRGYETDSQASQLVEEKPGTGTNGATNRSNGVGSKTVSAYGNRLRKPEGDTEEQRKALLQRDGSPVGALASSLLQNATTDRDKAYAIFCWIREHITYDNSTKWQRRYGNSGADQTPAGVLASGRAVCEGMANLFVALADRMGLQSVVVSGRASGMRQERHAWNAVMIDGKWGLVDITRHTFLASPQEFLARHFPNDPKWQLLDKPLTYEEWLKR